MKKPLLIQLCIPFCIKQCSYCSYPFCSYDPRTVHAYCDALLREIGSYEGDLEDHEVAAVSIEGGSPALLGADALFRVLGKIRRVFPCREDLQISLQTMPGDYSRALMEKMRDAGVNHWIIGLQTAQREEHRLLARSYKYEAITMADMAIRTFRPRNLSFDVLAGIPGQTEHSLEQTLARCLYYAPDHMTVYPLSVRKGSLLEEEIRNGSVPAPDPLQTDRLSRFAENWLTERGFEAYTPWDYAKPGCQSRYRSLLPEGCERIGIGYHSRSWLDGVMWQTGHSLQEYIEHSEDFQVVATDISHPDLQTVKEYFLSEMSGAGF